jgi:DNA-binding GntR family transcriptional regulator
MGDLRRLAAQPKSAVMHLSLPESVHEELRRRILNNELGAGTRLVEANLAEELGVSRATVRIALGRLSQEGLVEIAPRRHSTVIRMSYADIDDACYARYVLEDGAMRAIPDGELAELADELQEVADRMAALANAENLAALVDLDTEFHGRIVDHSHKYRLAGLWSMLDAQMGAVMRSSLEDQHIDLAEAGRRHHTLADAVRTGERAAISTALYEHYIRRQPGR